MGEMPEGEGALRRRALGRTGMEVTRVGFGAWAIGGAGWAFGWGTQDDDDSVLAIRHALDRGVNWIDTAAVYGLGHSEEVVAPALRDVPAADRPFVFTKCGLVWDENDREAPPRRVGRPDSIRRECEASLRRLGVDTLDLYQMHWPAEDGTPLEAYWGALLELKAEGKARAVGLSNHSLEQLEAAERVGHVDTLQPPFSAIHRDAAAELRWCAGHGTGTIVYSPMQSGLLTGAFTRERAATLADDDWRSRSPDFTGEGLERNLALASALKPVAERHGAPVAAAAVAWTLAWPGATAAIVGARTPGQCGRLDPRRPAGADGPGSRRDRRCHPPHRRGERPRAAVGRRSSIRYSPGGRVSAGAVLRRRAGVQQRARWAADTRDRRMESAAPQQRPRQASQTAWGLRRQAFARMAARTGDARAQSAKADLVPWLPRIHPPSDARRPRRA
jgi:aryl-alcohol dehydrogenase-like predicted oxidoreductase